MIVIGSRPGVTVERAGRLPFLRHQLTSDQCAGGVIMYETGVLQQRALWGVGALGLL
jgi:hypothetical protein